MSNSLFLWVCMLCGYGRTTFGNGRKKTQSNAECHPLSKAKSGLRQMFFRSTAQKRASNRNFLLSQTQSRASNRNFLLARTQGGFQTEFFFLAWTQSQTSNKNFLLLRSEVEPQTEILWSPKRDFSKNACRSARPLLPRRPPSAHALAPATHITNSAGNSACAAAGWDEKPAMPAERSSIPASGSVRKPPVTSAVIAPAALTSMKRRANERRSVPLL